MSLSSTSGTSALRTSSSSVSKMSTAGDQGRPARGSLSIRVKASSNNRRLANGSAWVMDICIVLLLVQSVLDLTSSDYYNKILVLFCQVLLSTIMLTTHHSTREIALSYCR